MSIIALAIIFLLPTKLWQYFHHFVQKLFLLTALARIKFTSRRATNIKKVVCHDTHCFTSIYVTFVNSKSFIKASGSPKMLPATTFEGYQIDKISTVTLQNSLTIYFRFVANQVKSGETTKTLSQFLLHSSIELSCCLVVLGGNNSDKMCLKFLW